MDNLDLETILSSSSASWMLPSFDQQDANFLSASRQMLEPIIEETSEDEDNQNWPQYDNVWSSESETGSVIRIELHNNDQDSISERDFACPAKRPRRDRDDLLIIEENISYKKYSQQRNDILAFNTTTQQQQQQQHQQQQQQQGNIITNNDNNNYNLSLNNTDNFIYYRNNKRFDDFYSDSDSLSYNSLSRSSSLIQFESLEKQLQSAELNNSSSLGNSSPSLLSIESNNITGSGNNCNNLDNNIGIAYNSSNNSNNNNTNNNNHHHHGNNCNKNSISNNNCLRRFESSESGLHHQTYYDINKIEFNNTMMFNNDNENDNDDDDEEDQNEDDDENDDEENDEDEDDDENETLHYNLHCINKNSDSESSDNSILSHEERIPKPSSSSSSFVYSSSIMNTTGNYCSNNLTINCNENRLYYNKGRSSVENLSEDSGYCGEHYLTGLSKIKSKSIPNFLRYNEKFLDQTNKIDDYDNYKSLETVISLKPQKNLKYNSNNDETTTKMTTTTRNLNRNSSSNSNSNCSKYCEYSKNENILDDNDDDDDVDDTIDENKIYPTTATTTTTAITTTKSTNIPTRKIQNEKQRGEFNSKIDTTVTTTISTAPKRTYYKNNEENNFSYKNQKQKHKIKSKQKQQHIQNNNSKNELMYNSSYSNNNNNNNDDRGCRMTIEDQVKNKIYPKPNRRNQINDSSSPLFLSPSSSSFSPPLVLGGSLAFAQRREFSLDLSAAATATAASTSSSSSSTSSTSSFLYQSRKNTSVLLYRSSSLPDIRIQCDDTELLLLSDGNNYLNSDDPHLSYDNDNFNSSSLFSNLCHKKNTLKKKLNNQFTQVSSLPNDLNAILCDSISSERFNCNVNNVTNEINYDDCEFDSNLKSGTNNNNKTTIKSTINRKYENNNRSFIDTVNFNSCYSSLNQSAKILSSSLSSGSAVGQNYMNASYNNLTLLDYSGRSRSNRNSFTMSDGSGNSKRNSREFEFSKGNFLLDEISSHFDKNLSILSDREHNSDLVSELLEKEKFSICENQQKPIPPARKSSLQKEQSKTKKSSSSSSSATAATTTEIAPTTMVAIEKPPRKHLSNNINKTFDQDPTILKTNYTESLEKCNFDPKEISNTDLTELQISNHSTPIKRGFVASTPNLNAFQRNHDDIDDDNLLHVCSAHTSMNQLTNEKKLGILLSDGSRASLCKGVSFCPIVSEIRWHEQSSEENTNPLDSLENMKTNQHDDQDDVNKQENFVNDQETITIITANTDEVDANNIIKLDTIGKSQVYINANNVQNTENKASPAELNEQQQQERDELKLTSKPDGMLNSDVRFETESTETETESEAMKFKVKQKDKTVSNVLIVEENVSNILNGADGGANNLNVNDKERCAIKDNLNDNKQKIILNEKMLNCASVNKSDDQKRGKHSDKEVNSMNKVISDNTNVNNNNNNNNNIGIKSATIPMMTSSTKSMGGNNKNFTVDSNTGTDILSAKFKAKPDEKHHKNGFLSRFTGGFRFSLRRKKKPSLSTTAGDLNANENNAITSNDKRKNKKNTADGNTNMNKNTSGSNKSPDFIYIPLKGPLPGRQSQQYSLPNNGKNRDDGHLLSHSENQSSFGNDNSHVLLGKPPLPKQPPRVVGVCEKVRTGTTPSQQQQKILSSASFQGIGSGGSYRHALESHSQRSSSQPREIDERFLNSERQYYSPSSDISYHQFNGAMNENGCSSPIMGTNNIITSLPPLPPTKCPITRPAGISIGSTIGPNGNAKIGLIETNLDTHETIISGKTRSLMELGPLQIRHTLSKQSAGSDTGDTVCIDGTSSRRPHKSMEFLLDKENQKNAMPPENELQKSHDSTAALSEHQLRVQASLQRLNIPDWFRQYSPSQQKLNDSTTTTTTAAVAYKPGSFTRKRASDSGRWAGLNSKTTSLSSLGSQRSDRSPLLLSPSAHSHHGGQIAGFSRWSTSHLNSTQTSPSVSTRGSFSRGNVINSSFISGHSFNSAGGGTSIRNSFRQPYLGWRSQEKLTSPRTPHERLASSLLSQKPPKPEPAVTPEIQTSIKEVTSAIVHYVNDQTNRTSRSRSTSPNSRKCWLESSFVGIRPVESPQTPTLDNSNCSFNAVTPTSLSSASTVSAAAAITSSGIINLNQNQNQNLIRMNGVGATTRPLPTLAIGRERSPSSASLEDVLASLLGLPTDSYRSTGDSANEMMTFRFTSSIPSNNNDNNNSLQVDSQNRFRRRSEGDAQKQQKHNQQQQQQQQQIQNQQQRSSITAAITTTTTNQLYNDLSNENNSSLTVINQQTSRRVSLDSSESKTTSELLIKCRNTKCDQSANPIDAKKYYKSCHNCSHLYCSRECRRAHWEKHRKACLHSRVSNLCRQVLSSCKDDSDTLRHLSLLARKGYLSQGRGVVRVLFRSPENAEAFMKNGFQCLGEASYVRWPDLMPAEMGIELYSELLRLSTEYKPDSKMLIYVAICVVSEAPGTGTAPVKWERQLVSRCAKLKLCKTILSELSEFQITSNTNTTAVTTTAAAAASSAGDATATTNNTIMTNSSQEQQTEILILTFNTQKKINSQQREMIITNIQAILNRRGVILRRHYPEIYQRLQNFIENQNDRFMPVTIHPRDTQTGHGFVCIIMPILNENDLKHLPASDSGNRVSIIDVGEDLMES